MTLKQEVPIELKEFAGIMDSAQGRFSYNDWFTDFVDYMTACFLTTGDPALANRLKDKYGNQYHIFDKLLMAYLEMMKKENLVEGYWYDGFGIIYETITSRWKSSKMGQFFTPPSIVDLMTMFTEDDGEKQKGKTINDPTCGSGRMLIAHHVRNLGNYYYGQDLDPICTKMTALNMLLHGCIGEVACMDTLQMKWYFGYKINPYLMIAGIPCIKSVESWEQSAFYVAPQPKKEVRFQSIKEVIEDTPKVKIHNKKPDNMIQLSLF
jgi:type I restriction enzyme M protein